MAEIFGPQAVAQRNHVGAVGRCQDVDREPIFAGLDRACQRGFQPPPFTRIEAALENAFLRSVGEGLQHAHGAPSPTVVGDIEADHRELACPAHQAIQ